MSIKFLFFLLCLSYHSKIYAQDNFCSDSNIVKIKDVNNDLVEDSIFQFECACRTDELCEKFSITDGKTKKNIFIEIFASSEQIINHCILPKSLNLIEVEKLFNSVGFKRKNQATSSLNWILESQKNSIQINDQWFEKITFFKPFLEKQLEIFESYYVCKSENNFNKLTYYCGYKHKWHNSYPIIATDSIKFANHSYKLYKTSTAVLLQIDSQFCWIFNPEHHISEIYKKREGRFYYKYLKSAKFSEGYIWIEYEPHFYSAIIDIKKGAVIFLKQAIVSKKNGFLFSEKDSLNIAEISKLLEKYPSKYFSIPILRKNLGIFGENENKFIHQQEQKFAWKTTKNESYFTFFQWKILLMTIILISLSLLAYKFFKN